MKPIIVVSQLFDYLFIFSYKSYIFDKNVSSFKFSSKILFYFAVHCTSIFSLGNKIWRLQLWVIDSLLNIHYMCATKHMSKCHTPHMCHQLFKMSYNTYVPPTCQNIIHYICATNLSKCHTLHMCHQPVKMSYITHVPQTFQYVFKIKKLLETQKQYISSFTALNSYFYN